MMAPSRRQRQIAAYRLWLFRRAAGPSPDDQETRQRDRR